MQVWGVRLCLALVLLAMVAVPAVAQDPFEGAAQSIQNAAPLWAKALALLGAVIAGGAIIMGSQSSGKWAGRFIGGSAFLAITLKGPEALVWIASLFGGR